MSIEEHFSNPYKSDAWFYEQVLNTSLKEATEKNNSTETISITTPAAKNDSSEKITNNLINSQSCIIKIGATKRIRKQPSKQLKSFKCKRKAAKINNQRITNFLTVLPSSTVNSDESILFLEEKDSEYNIHGPVKFNEWLINSTEWLTNGHINAFQSLMYNQYLKQGFTGFVHPAKFSTMTRDYYLNPDTIHDFLFVTVLNAGDHWVTLTNYNPFYVEKINDAGLGIWFLYESLNKPEHYLNKVAPALKRLNINDSQIRVLACNMPQQYGMNDCGLFALAYAISICEQKQPSKLIFQQMSMRDIYNCVLQTEALKPFDFYEINDDRLVNYNEYYVNMRDVNINY